MRTSHKFMEGDCAQIRILEKLKKRGKSLRIYNDLHYTVAVFLKTDNSEKTYTMIEFICDCRHAANAQPTNEGKDISELHLASFVSQCH